VPTSSIEKKIRTWNPIRPTEIRQIEVGILGATGIVGQQMVARLERHRWFRATWLAASVRSAGQRYGDLPWRLASPMPAKAASLTVGNDQSPVRPAIDFFGAGSAVAEEGRSRIRGRRACGSEQFAKSSHGSARATADSRSESRSSGSAAASKRKEGLERRDRNQSNCSTRFSCDGHSPRCGHLIQKRVLVTTLQALSGAGYPGVASLDASANVIPYIEGEEEKIEAESRKILGCFENGGIEP